MLDEEEQEAERALAERNRINDMRAVLGTPQGRRVLWRILEHAAVYQSTFMRESDRISALLEGKRGVGLWLINEITTADLHAYSDLLRAASEAQAEAEAVVKRATEQAAQDNDEVGA